MRPAWPARRQAGVADLFPGNGPAFSVHTVERFQAYGFAQLLILVGIFGFLVAFFVVVIVVIEPGTAQQTAQCAFSAGSVLDSRNVSVAINGNVNRIARSSV